ncbi:MAG TPA: DUF2637 domain-containing protein [Streptosporangiaceae bacterium]|nr:DUF2637 domain-containing protein [Streptosporangiaceae bacterium]
MDVTESLGVRWSDRAIGVICWVTTIAALGLSYRGLLDFASQRGGLPLWAAVAWPILLDAFLVLGELRWYTANARHEDKTYIKVWAALLTLVGLLASVAGNIAHVGLGATWPEKLAAVVPPLAAAASLGTGLGLVKRRSRSGGDSGHERSGAGATPQPRASAPARPARARRLGSQPSAEQLLAWATQDRLDDLPMGWVSFQRRHADKGVTEHYAKQAVKMISNGES